MVHPEHVPGAVRHTLLLCFICAVSLNAGGCATEFRLGGPGGRVDGGDGGNPSADGAALSDSVLPDYGQFGEPTCGEVRYEAMGLTPSVLIVLDRSGSMEEPFGPKTSWKFSIAQRAVRRLVEGFGDQVRFGVMLFPGCPNPSLLPPIYRFIPYIDNNPDARGCSSDCAIESIAVPIAAGSASDIISFIESAETCFCGTPIAGALRSAVGYEGLKDASKSNAVLILTDGKENCYQDPVAAVEALRKSSPTVETFVVGFGEQVDPRELNAMAVAGGTALAGRQSYYQAGDEAGLDKAFTDILRRVLGCEFTFDESPPDGDHLFVLLGDELLDKDAENGWTFDVDSRRLTIHGEACARIEAGEVEDVEVFFGCPIEQPY